MVAAAREHFVACGFADYRTGFSLAAKPLLHQSIVGVADHGMAYFHKCNSAAWIGQLTYAALRVGIAGPRNEWRRQLIGPSQDFTVVGRRRRSDCAQGRDVTG
jgi:hypothetical protein